nr:PREDICTED: uncharacterized protein LOC105662506 [Megachile rotundata]
MAHNNQTDAYSSIIRSQLQPFGAVAGSVAGARVKEREGGRKGNREEARQTDTEKKGARKRCYRDRRASRCFSNAVTSSRNTTCKPPMRTGTATVHCKYAQKGACAEYWKRGAHA